MGPGTRNRETERPRHLKEGDRELRSGSKFNVREAELDKSRNEIDWR